MRSLEPIFRIYRETAAMLSAMLPQSPPIFPREKELAEAEADSTMVAPLKAMEM